MSYLHWHIKRRSSSKEAAKEQQKHTKDKHREKSSHVAIERDNKKDFLQHTVSN